MPRNGVPGIKSPDPRGSGHSDKPKKPAGLFRPAAAQGFVKVDQSQVLVAHGIADPDLGVEIAALRIQHVDIIDAPAPVLQLGEFDVFPGCVAQVNLQRGRPANAAVLTTASFASLKTVSTFCSYPSRASS